MDREINISTLANKRLEDVIHEFNCDTDKLTISGIKFGESCTGLFANTDFKEIYFEQCNFDDTKYFIDMFKNAKVRETNIFDYELPKAVNMSEMFSGSDIVSIAFHAKTPHEITYMDKFAFETPNLERLIFKPKNRFRIQNKCMITTCNYLDIDSHSFIYGFSNKNFLGNGKDMLFGDNVITDEYIITDIETTGLDPESETAGIVEVYMAKYNRKTNLVTEIVNKTFYHPNYKDTQHLHKIPDEEIINRPRFEDSEEYQLIRDTILSCTRPDGPALMAYYAPFEYTWYKKFLKFTDEELEHLRVCDPREINKMLVPSVKHNLIPSAKIYCNIVPEWGWAFHRAKDDSLAMCSVFLKLLTNVYCDEVYDYETYHYDVESKRHD